MTTASTAGPLSPGYFQTHAAAGATWRSAPLARLVDEETIALLVNAFNAGQWGNVDSATAHANRQSILAHHGPLRGAYRVKGWNIEITADAATGKPTVRTHGEP